MFFRQEQVEGLAWVVGVRVRQVEKRFDALGQGSSFSRLAWLLEKGFMLCEGNGAVPVCVDPLEIGAGVSW